MMNINKEIAIDIMNSLTEEKKESLKNALNRNLALTSCRVLEWGDMTVYKEGFYLHLAGTRCGFSVFAKDNDGTLEILSRKPVDSKLNLIYKETFIRFDENDFDSLF